MLLWRDKPDPAALPSSWETHQRPPESEGARDDKMTRDDKRDPCGAMMPIKVMLERNECDDL